MWSDCHSFKLKTHLNICKCIKFVYSLATYTVNNKYRYTDYSTGWQYIQVMTSIKQTTVPVGLAGMTSDLRSPSPSAVLRAVRTAWVRPPWLAWTWTIFFWGRSAAGVTKFLLYDKVLGPATRRRNLLSGISHCKIYGTLRCVMRCILNSAKRNQSLMKSYILFKIAK